jgi:rhamnogalacturonyl hydrolase YesR
MIAVRKTFGPVLLACATIPLLIAACGEAPREAQEPAIEKDIATLALANPSEFARIDEAVSISLDELGIESGQGVSLVVMDDATEVPSQLIDADGDGTPDTLLIVADFEAAEEREFVIRHGSPAALAKRTQAEVSIREGGEWDGKLYKGGTFVNVSEIDPPPQHTDHSEYIRYEGPGLESDKVGYRVYLDWRNGFDIFGKLTTDMVLQDVGQDGYDSYHEPAAWGMDILKVGDAVGMGGYGYWDGEKIIRVSETENRAVRIIEDGALYSAFRIDYTGWQAGGHTTDLGATLSMTAGSRLVKVQLAAFPDFPNLTAGLVRHPGTEFIEGDLEISGHAWSWVASWGQQALSGDELGMFLLFKKGVRTQQTEDEHNYVSVMEPGNGKLAYYFGAAWVQEPGGIHSRDALVEYLEREAERLTMPLRMRLTTDVTAAQTDQPIDAEKALEWSVRLAESEVARLGPSLQHEGFDATGNREAKWSYTTGLIAQAMDDLSTATGMPQFAEWGKATLDSYVTEDGEILTYDASLYNIDHVNSGKMLLRYLERTGDEKYALAADAIRAQLADHPRTSEGAFWHKQRYPWQLWLDGVYMGMPFLAHYDLNEGNMHGVEEAIAEALIVDRRLRDADSGLYYHAWDEKAEQVWADPDTGLSRYFWSRGMGWYAMALVDLLDFVPEDRADLRKPVIDVIQRFADAILAHRVDGVWFQVTDRPQALGNYKEASGSSMFVYMLAKAVNKGYLDASYAAPAADAYASLVSEFINVGASGAVSLRSVCQVAGLGYGRDGSYRYYMSEPVISNDPKGVGPFIMAGIQVSKMLSGVTNLQDEGT